MTSRIDTDAIRAWWETCARSVNIPTPHWSIPVLCDEVDRLCDALDVGDAREPGWTLQDEMAEVDRLRAEADVMATLVRRLYTCDWADPISDEQEAMLTRIVEGDGRG